MAVYEFRCLEFSYVINNNFMIVFIYIGGESIPDNPLDDLKGVNATGPLYSR